MATLANVKIGICSVTFKGTDLGHTKGSVKFTYKPEYDDIVVNQFGKSVTDKVLVKEVVEVKVPLAETQLAQINVALPNIAAGTASLKKFGNEAGARLSTVSGELLLHPTAVTGTGEDIVLYKAVVTGDVELEYAVDGQRVLELTFSALVDSTKSNGNVFGHFGTIS